MKDSGQKETEKQGLTSEVRLYIEKRMELLSITVAEQVSLLVAQSIQKLIGVLILAGAIFFLWFSFGFFIGELVDSYALGFLLSSVPLFLFGFILSNHKSKKITEKIQAEIVGKVIQNFEKKEDNSDSSDG